uniref:TLC domain-containing protein 2 n=2 Tax=Ascaris TaxID=6251 RepID=F1L9Q4_ASCSU
MIRLSRKYSEASLRSNREGSYPARVVEKVQIMVEASYVGAEWRIPPMHGFLETAFIIPIIVYFFIFEAIALCIRSSTWTNHPSFERYRLHNLSVSLVHSTITGGSALTFMLINPHIMFGDTMHWYETWAAQLPLFSMGYFCHDVFDILSHERSRYAFEVLVHHAVIFSVFSVGMLAHKFLPYAYWALLVEINSVFLHARSIMEISLTYVAHRLIYRVVRILSIATFVVFRFGILTWMLYYIIMNRRHFHEFYMYSGAFADIFFLIFSAILFSRILAEDGFFGERIRRKTSL